MSRPAERRRQGCRRRGFTLIELMVSIVLLGIVLTLVYSSFFQLSAGARSVERQLEARQEVRLLVKMLADDLRAVQWLKQYVAGNEARRTGIVGDIDFVEGRDFSRVDFHAAGPARFHRDVPPEADPGLHEIGYRVRLNENRDKLELVRREDFYLDDDITEGGVEVPIAENIEVFRVEYLPAATSSTGPEPPWEERWNVSLSAAGEARLPAAIRVTIGQKEEDGKVLEESLEFNLTQKP